MEGKKVAVGEELVRENPRSGLTVTFRRIAVKGWPQFRIVRITWPNGFSIDCTPGGRV